MKSSNHKRAGRVIPMLAAAVLALTAALLPAGAQETFEHLGTVTAINPIAERVTLRGGGTSDQSERLYTLPQPVYRNATDSDDHPVTLRPGHFVAVSGYYRDGQPVIANLRVLGFIENDSVVE